MKLVEKSIQEILVIVQFRSDYPIYFPESSRYV